MPPRIKPEKICTGCGRRLPREAYTRDGYNPKTGVVYVHSMCKKCRSFKNAIQNENARKQGKRIPPAMTETRRAQLREAGRIYRARIKADPERYAEHCEAERLRVKAYRMRNTLRKHHLKEMK